MDQDLISLCRRLREEDQRQDQIHDPHPLNPKGRPRTARITGPLEGKPRGGGVRAGGFDLRKAPKRSRLQLDIDRAGAGSEDDDEDEALVKRRRVTKCSICRQPGHRRDRCPLVPRV